MTRRPHCIGLICVAALSGCQSLDTPVLPWQTSQETKYTAEQIAAMNNPQPVAARAGLGNKVQQTVSATATSQPVSSGRVEQLIQSGQAALRDGQTPMQLGRARQNFHEALNLDDSNARAHHGIAIVADLEEDWPAAEFHYKQALRQRPQDPDFLNDLGYSYLLQDRYYEASKYLTQAVQVSAHHEHAHINLALLSLKRGDRVAAENRLANIYSPEDVNTTLARLEDDLRSTDGNDVRVDVSQPLSASFEDTKRLMAEERERAQRARQEKSLQEQQRLAAGRQQAPTRGITLPQPQYGMPQQHTAGFQAASNAPGMPPERTVPPTGYLSRSPSNVPQPGSAAVSGMTLRNDPNHNYRTGHLPSQVAHDSSGGVVPVSSTADLSTYVPPATAAASQYGRQTQYEHGPDVSAPRGLIQQVTPSQTPHGNGFAPSSAARQQLQNSAPQNYNAPVAGLNAGPGALFPIGAGNVSPGATRMTQVQSMGSQAPDQTQFPRQNNGGVPGQALVPERNTMYQQPLRVLPAEQHMHQMQQMQYDRENPTPTIQPPISAVPAQGRRAFGAGGVLTPPGLSPQYHAPGQQVAGNSATTQMSSQGMHPSGYQYGAGQRPASQVGSVAAPSPLAAYEQQLRGLNSQYNQAIQQVDGTRTGLQPVQARY